MIIFIDFLPCAQHCDRFFSRTQSHPQVVIFILIVQRRGEKTKPKMHKLFVQDDKAMLKARYNTNLQYPVCSLFLSGDKTLLNLLSISTSTLQRDPAPGHSFQSLGDYHHLLFILQTCWTLKVRKHGAKDLKCRYHVAPVSALRELKIWSGTLVLINNPHFFSQFAFILLLFWNFSS